MCGVIFMQAQRPSAKTFRDLLVWQKAHESVLEVYRYTESFPQREIYGLVQQMRKDRRVHTGERCRRFQAAWQGRQSAIHEHCREFA